MKKNIILLSLLWCLIFAHVSAAETSDIKDILSSLEKKVSGMQTLQTDFVQEKELAVFNQKLILKGTVFLEKPARLAWHVTEPMRYSMIMKDQMIRQWDEDTNEIQEISLAKNPAFQTAVGQMQEWFSGTYTSLLREYEVALFKKNPTALKFTPRENALAANVISSVTVFFREDERYIHQIYIEEKSGDNTRLTFVNTVLNPSFDKTVWEVKPGVR
ncbi:outer membrane lipoprotein carrier protein LolA [Desulfococcaceae bacterium HSG8]|nr:outer membrane lipoprotein carrier protein LolA [Desulfococcaceae bacterium HSG8]